MAALCQDCDGCCRVLEVREHPVSKAFHEPCKHLGTTAHGLGCMIYATRPTVCWTYECLWLNSQRRVEVEKMPEALRPDVCKVVIGRPQGNQRDVLEVYPYPDHQDAWRYPPVSDHLRMVLSRGGKVMVVLAKHRIAMRGDMAVFGTEEEFEKLLA